MGLGGKLSGLVWVGTLRPGSRPPMLIQHPTLRMGRQKECMGKEENLLGEEEDKGEISMISIMHLFVILCVCGCAHMCVRGPMHECVPLE